MITKDSTPRPESAARSRPANHGRDGAGDRADAVFAVLVAFSTV